MTQPSPQPPRLRAVLAEDEPFLRGLLAEYLQNNGVDVVALASEPVGLLRAVRSTSPDVAVIDIMLPPGKGTEGLEAAKEIRQKQPAVGIMLLSKHIQTRFLTDLLGQGQAKVGYWLKESVAGPDDFATKLRRIAAGDCVLDPQVVAAMLGRPQVRSRLAVLSARELEVLSVMAEGLPNRQICDRLRIDEKTVGTHISRIFAKLGLGDNDNSYQRRVRAVLIYLQSYGRLSGVEDF
jgi:DNA-binding NarL/FixJ family response regulator